MTAIHSSIRTNNLHVDGTALSRLRSRVPHPRPTLGGKGSLLSDPLTSCLTSVTHVHGRRMHGGWSRNVGLTEEAEDSGSGIMPDVVVRSSKLVTGLSLCRHVYALQREAGIEEELRGNREAKARVSGTCCCYGTPVVATSGCQIRENSLLPFTISSSQSFSKSIIEIISRIWGGR